MAFDPLAEAPVAWLSFLHSVFHDDPDSIRLLRQWFGYCLTDDVRFDKMLFIFGPPRAGEGTIVHALTAILGKDNVSGPTLASFGMNFGLQPLVGKSLAVINDARISGRSDQAAITERLLSLTGEDGINIDRKNLPQITTRLRCRMMLTTNDLPNLRDQSRALSSRFLTLHLKRSFLGQEDRTLKRRILDELPGIVLWALDGLVDLHASGAFVEPAASKALSKELGDLMSPITAFVGDCCTLATGAEILKSNLFAAWCQWCDGRQTPSGSQATFGKDLLAAVGLETFQSRKLSPVDRPEWAYRGIELQPHAVASSGSKFR